MFTESEREKWFKFASDDFEIRHAAGGPFDEIDIRNAFIRGCIKGYAAKTAEKITTELLSVEAKDQRIAELESILSNKGLL